MSNKPFSRWTEFACDVINVIVVKAEIRLPVSRYDEDDRQPLNRELTVILEFKISS